MSGTITEHSQGAAGDHSAPLLELSYFTDPLCCWSWGFEAQLRRLRFGFAGRIAWRLRMGTMIRDWASFDDPVNSVHRPAQMGPMWIEASVITGMPMDPTLWVVDPPASSVPACRAVRAAGLQSARAADLYLRCLREAVMLEGRNIARPEVLRETARTLEEIRPGQFDARRFESDLGGRLSALALDDDIREARYKGIARFPCVVMRRSGVPPVSIVGWRPYEVLIEEIRAFMPDLGPERRVETPDQFRTYWGGAIEHEVATATGHTGSSAAAAAASLSSGSG